MATKSSTLHLRHSKVEKETTVLVKPSKPTPNEVLSLSTLDNDPLNETMSKTIHVYAANPDNGGKEPVSVLQQALATVLVYYYPFAGKIRRRSCDRRLELICNGDGVPFAAATVDCTLSDVNNLAGYDRDAMAQLLVPDYDVSHDFNKLYHPLALQVTRFSCGGFTIGWVCAHTICDGSARSLFIQALAELASGRTEPSVKPLWERERLVPAGCDRSQQSHALESPVLALSPHMPTDDTVSEIVSVAARSIRALKAMMMKESKDISCTFTTFEVLAAYVWRSRARALEFKPEETIILNIVFGIRNILDPPLPQGYYGNTILDNVIQLTRKEVDELSLYEIVKLIKEAKKTFNSNRYVQDQIRNTEKRVLSNVKMFEEDKGGAVMSVTDWRNLGFINKVVDFGWKTAIDVIPVVSSPARLCFILSPLRTDSVVAVEDGARVLMTLPMTAMPRFKQEIEALNMLDL